MRDGWAASHAEMAARPPSQRHLELGRDAPEVDRAWPWTATASQLPAGGSTRSFDKEPSKTMNVLLEYQGSLIILGKSRVEEGERKITRDRAGPRAVQSFHYRSRECLTKRSLRPISL